jgi:hypothetical protein
MLAGIDITGGTRGMNQVLAVMAPDFRPIVLNRHD